jgi:membrane protease subunit (stomatin/prohibitin family)
VQVQDIGLPEELELAIDKAGAMRVIGDMQVFTQYETANSIRDAATNPGGLAAAGAGAGMGLGIGGQMAGAMGSMFTGQAQPPIQPAAGGASAVPPPVSLKVQFYVAVNGQQEGPFDMATLQQMALAGKLTRDSLVWKQGMAAWDAAGMVAEISPMFAVVPPPLPAA